MRKATYLQITRKCNNQCIFCSNPQFEKDYSFEEAKQRVLEFKVEGITEIFLTGGEPTLVKFLPELIKYIIKQSPNPKIITNGVNISDNKLNNICIGIQREYLDIHGDKELFPVFTNPEKIIQKIENGK